MAPQRLPHHLSTPAGLDRRERSQHRIRLVEEKTELLVQCRRLKDQCQNHDQSFQHFLALGFEKPAAAYNAIMDRMRADGPLGVDLAADLYKDTEGSPWQQRQPGPWTHPNRSMTAHLSADDIAGARERMCETLKTWNEDVKELDTAERHLGDINRTLATLPEPKKTWSLFPSTKPKDRQLER